MSTHEFLLGLNKANGTIKCPYPGLRPFQDEDAEYFFGRDCQIREVVNRLKSSRFVAVIGGSGSGKSSLVLAGAIPKLRTFAIRGSGDFWVPIVTTPGTNHIDGDTPIRRLAKKFCAVLNELPPEQEQERLEECSQMLREHNGLEQVVKKWGRDIKNNDGVDLSLKAYGTEAAEGVPAVRDNTMDPPYMVKVNFLFLIDQFEELFHPSNSSVNADCKHIVDRIVDHYQQGSRNDSCVCMAITMRSEHLNDCSRYPDLPDAINATAYLVKRLNEFELREAIERPAKRFLRRQFQESCQCAKDNGLPLPDEDEWPEDVTFDGKVIDRLLRDADNIIGQQDHADHLPLLQHLLYWIWTSAMERNLNSDRPFLDAILVEDLISALDTSSKTVELSEHTNTLTQCLKHRCEWTFNHYPERRLEWETVFRSLAFKEPNTGTYTQRRAPMAELCNRPNMTVSNKEELKCFLMPWIEPHPYLFWDESSQTVKVTHEALIRRWKRFRDWTDLEDRQFQAYLQILEDCIQWVDNGKTQKELIEGIALRRVEDCKLLDALRDDGTQKQFDNLLRMHRDRDRLHRGVKSIHEFLDRSLKKRHGKRLLRQVAFFAALGVVITVSFGMHLWNGSQYDDQQIKLLRSYGIAAETLFAMPKNGSVDKLDEVQLALENMLKAIEYHGYGQEVPAFTYLSFLYKNKIKAAQKFTLLSGARTTSGLRRMLVENAWRHQPDIQHPSKIINAKTFECNIQSNNPKIRNDIEFSGKKAEFFTSNERGEYGLIALQDMRNFNTQVFWGKFKEGACYTSFEQLIYWSSPNAKLGFDANQRYLVESDRGLITITSIDWPVDGHPLDGQSLPTSIRLRYNNPIDNSEQESLQLNGAGPHVLLPTITGEFIQDIQIGNQWFRFFDLYPVRTQMESEQYDEARKADTDNSEGLCSQWKGTVSSPNNALDVWELKKSETEAFCLVISHLTDQTGTYFGDLYRVREDTLNAKDQNLLPMITSIALGRTKPDQIRFDLQNGHLLSKSGGVWLKQPWSADAWVTLAKGVINGKNNRESLNDIRESRYLLANLFFQDEDNPDNGSR